ncbi:MAG TPA: CYTH and CHAD domain-containing protein [Candidatus Dormibacteraeota bacterium]|nr:CYTH and CHAD domain-containing protein [Candidatus Dormibacteraeota bacterium]
MCAGARTTGGRDLPRGRSSRAPAGTHGRRSAVAEREVKLGAAPTFRLPELAGVADGVTAGPQQERRLEATYYDTADLRLARWGLSLRHRNVDGWTLKLPDSLDGPVLARSEVTFAGTARRPPPEALALVRAYLRGAPVERVARLSTWRRRVPLLDAGGGELAEVVDDEVSVLSGRRVAARFREVEVELRPGGEGLLGPVLDRLRQAGAGRADPTPKHVRALGPAATGPPDVAVRRLPAAPAAVDVVRNALAAGTQLVLRHDPRVRVGGDPEDVHQMRVGTRRLRSHLRTFRPLLDREWTDSLRDELGWLAGELGVVRDAEVLLERLRELARQLPDVDQRAVRALLRELEASVEAGRARLLEAISSQRYYDLLERLVAAADHPVPNPEAPERLDAPAPAALLPLARRPWRALATAVRALDAHPDDDDLHRIRILAKRVRYAAEAVTPAVGGGAGRLARLAAGLQTVLGEHQDSVVARAWLRSAARGQRRAFVAGQLSALEAGIGAAARRSWPQAWRQLARRRMRSWMAATPT